MKPTPDRRRSRSRNRTPIGARRSPPAASTSRKSKIDEDFQKMLGNLAHYLGRVHYQVTENIKNSRAPPTFDQFHPFVSKFFKKMADTLAECPDGGTRTLMDDLQVCYEGFWDLRRGKVWHAGVCEASEFVKGLDRNIDLVRGWRK